MDTARQGLSDALQDIDQVVVRVDVVWPVGEDEALQDDDVPGIEFGPAEPPVLSIMLICA